MLYYLDFNIDISLSCTSICIIHLHEHVCIFLLSLTDDVFLDEADANTFLKNRELNKRGLWEECVVEGCDWEEVSEVVFIALPQATTTTTTRSPIKRYGGDVEVANRAADKP